MLTCLYHTCIGRLVLKFLTWPPLSRLVGHFLDTRLVPAPYSGIHSSESSEYGRLYRGGMAQFQRILYQKNSSGSPAGGFLAGSTDLAL